MKMSCPSGSFKDGYKVTFCVLVWCQDYFSLIGHTVVMTSSAYSLVYQKN